MTGGRLRSRILLLRFFFRRILILPRIGQAIWLVVIVYIRNPSRRATREDNSRFEDVDSRLRLGMTG